MANYMRRNLIVLGGVAILILTGQFVPVLSFPQKQWYVEPMQTTRIISAASLLVGFVILWFMQTTSKWRGVLWIVLSVLGPLLTIYDVHQQYETFISWGNRLIPNYTSGTPSYQIGLYLVLLGYLIVIIGSVWDLRQKWHQENLNIISSPTAPQGNVE